MPVKWGAVTEVELKAWVGQNWINTQFEQKKLKNVLRVEQKKSIIEIVSWTNDSDVILRWSLRLGISAVINAKKCNPRWLRFAPCRV